MKAILLVIGKTDEDYIQEGIANYLKRIKRYIPFTLEVIPAIKHAGKLSHGELKKREEEEILNKLSPSDRIILLDENGREMASRPFSQFLSRELGGTAKRLVFVIAGAYGAGEELKKRAGATLSLSKMTFSHQLVRLVFLEQLYRGLTILRGEPYHHD
jgi:23S rRNA (pseudouridine1915-N3)-methyltransferase